MSIFVIHKVKETNKSTSRCMGEIYCFICLEPLPAGNHAPLLPGLGTGPSPLCTEGEGCQPQHPTPRLRGLTSDQAGQMSRSQRVFQLGAETENALSAKQLLAAAPIRIGLSLHQKPEDSNINEMAVHLVRHLKLALVPAHLPAPLPTRCLLKTSYCKYPPLST